MNGKKYQELYLLFPLSLFPFSLRRPQDKSCVTQGVKPEKVSISTKKRAKSRSKNLVDKHSNGGNTRSMKTNRFNRVLLCSCALGVMGFSQACGSEVSQFRTLREVGTKKAKLASEKFEKLFREQPELKRYIRRPSSRNLLQGLGQSKGVDTVYVLGIRAEFQPDTDSLTTGNGLMDRDHNEFPYDSLGHPTVGYRNFYRDEWDTPFDSIRGNTGHHSLYYDPPHTKKYFEHLLEFAQNYWWDVSDHKVWIEFQVVPEGESTCYQLPHKLSYYGHEDDWTRGILTLIKDAVVTSDRESPSINFRKYTGNSGGIIVFHAGASWQTDWFWDSPRDMPDCFVSGLDDYFGQPIWVDGGSVPVVDAMLYSETAFQDGMQGFLQGGLVHEMGHQLGLWDLYDTSGKTMGVGGWALMGSGNWNLSGLLPPAVCAHSSKRLGFIDPVVLDANTTDKSIQMRCSPDTGAATPKIYEIPIRTGEYYLVENRFVDVSKDTAVYEFQCYEDAAWTIPCGYSTTAAWHLDSSGVRVWKDGVLTDFSGYYDWGLPPDSGMGGLAIWHVDLDKIAQDSADNSVNAGSPKGVDMEEADGIQDFDTPWWLISDPQAFFYGSPYDVFFDPSAPEFGPYTSPNTNDNSDGVTHISVYNISKPDPTMDFSLRFDLRHANFPVQCCGGGYFDVNSPNVAEVGGSRIVFTGVMDTCDAPSGFVGGIVLAIGDSGDVLWADTAIADPDDPHSFCTNLFSSVAVGDIEGDGALAVVAVPFVVWSWSKERMFVRHDKQKSDPFISIVAGLQAWTADSGKLLFARDSVAFGAVYGAPLLADIDLDGRDEILLGATDGKLYVFDENGNTVWSKDLYEEVWATPVWDSVNSAIYAVALDGRLWAISPDSNTLWTAVEPGIAPTRSSPVVGDITGDGHHEIIVNAGGRTIWCINDSGGVVWKREMDDISFYSSPALADIDGDQLLDIIIAAGSKIYVFNSNGANVRGFPIDTESSKWLQSSPVIGDIDGDNDNEIIIGCPDGKLLGYTNEGKVLPGFPLSVGGAVWSTPVLADLDKDGMVEIVLGTDDGKLHGWSIGKCGDLPWPSIHCLASNNGIYKGSVVVSPGSVNAFMVNDLYVYPNPITSKGKVRYFSGDADKVEIKIIDLSGNVVKEIEGKIGTKNYQDVDLPYVPSGVYLCRVEVEGGGKTLVRFSKFAVVR
jgi:M6 family metalloprotease-like protein